MKLIHSPVRGQAEEGGECRAFKFRSRGLGLTAPHQRCDGKRPCAACVRGGKDAECTYELWQGHRHTRANVLPVTHDTGSPQSTLPSGVPTIGPSLSVFPTRPPSDVPLLTWSNSGESTSPPPPPLASCELPQAPTAQPPREPSPPGQAEMVHGPPSDASAALNIHDTTECVPRPAASSFTVLPSIHFPTIPRLLRAPFSLIPPERVQISPIIGGDLDMTLYAFFRLLNSHWFM